MEDKNMYDVKKQVISKINNTGFQTKINYKKVNGKYFLFMNYRKTTEEIKINRSKHLVVLTGTDKSEDLKRVKRQ
jgi:hypothetical protein